MASTEVTPYLLVGLPKETPQDMCWRTRPLHVIEYALIL